MLFVWPLKNAVGRVALLRALLAVVSLVVQLSRPAGDSVSLGVAPHFSARQREQEKKKRKRMKLVLSLLAGRLE